MATVETATEIRPFQFDIQEEALEDLRRRIEATRLPSKELVEDRSQGVQLATIQELATYWVSDYDLGRVEARLNALPAVHDGDRRRGHPLHPRQLAARERVAADHDARLAGLCHGDDRLRRHADGPDRARRKRRGCLPPGAALLAGYGFSGEPVEVGWDLGRTARAWAELMRPPRLHPLRGPGRRRGRRRHRRDGPPGTRRA